MKDIMLQFLFKIILAIIFFSFIFPNEIKKQQNNII